MKRAIRKKTVLKINNSVEGENIETVVLRITTTKEPIGESAEIIYTERKDGVLPQYDIRTDRFDVALDAMERYSGAKRAKRLQTMEDVKATVVAKNDGKPEPTEVK